ncbi:MAG: UvrD-helicase domain-containing protein [Clostridiales bacterium]|nr:UvrD-helicase domain-containing protein [Clostridiales bacterium]
MLNEHNFSRFCALRRSVIALDYQKLNPEQREGVLTTQGPLLLLAGAGSGKTTVLINRIANLIKYGQGSDSSEVPDWVTEEDVAFLEDYLNAPNEADRSRAEMLCKLRPAAPWSIIAITFTNKAAGELKSRLEAMLGPEGQDVWAFTFHSACVRILRRDIDKLGYRTAFTIYDTDDSLRVIKEILKAQNVDDKMFPPRMVLSNISKAKDNMLLAADFLAGSQKSGDVRLIQIGKIYVDYEKRLREADALDFDDLILQTVRLLQTSQEARDYWQRKFHYVLVDEYQDTNHLQYLLAALLAGERKNICVVGDDDQSIYRFRGATIENILDFESQYKGARVIRLEQNYRSTQNILNAANAVIRNNTGRKGKNLWTNQEGGDKVKVYTAMNENDEAQYVAAQVLAGISKGRDWKDFAVLYRMNAQSNQLEYAFKRNAIPYKVVGGTKFFDRAEIKDMLAYLCVINNPADDLRLRRIINTPARGIGNRTIEIATGIAQQLGLPLYEVVSHAGDYPMLQKSLPKLQAFVDIIEGLREKVETMELTDFYDEVMADTGYVAALEAKKTVESRTRVENVRELKSSIQGYLENNPDGDLEGFLDEVALYTDLDGVDEKENAVVIMTMHAAKGLEFPVVFVVGMEDGLFPGMRSIGDDEEMEEERRLCYVALTRARETLCLSCARQRMLFGHTTSNKPSRFLEEIPEEFTEKSGRSLTEENREYGGQWKDSRQGENGERPRYAGRGAGGRGTYSSRPRRSRRDDGKPLGGGISVSHAVTPTGQRAVQATFSLLSQFKKGDMVDHSAFGKGMIVSILPMGGDALVEVAFDGVGNKKLMLKAASQHMKKVESL